MNDEANQTPQSNINVRSELFNNEQIELPEIIDVFIVGAGAAGIAAAFRAQECGLSCLVIDRDDILEVLRAWSFDYDKPKLVDANYTAQARKTPFPGGGPIVETLAYSDRSSANDLYHRWIQQFIENKIPIRTGMELTDLQEEPDGTLKVECRRASETGILFKTRSVFLGIGAGVPNQLRIPGDVGGIPTSTGSGERFIGGPTCVIGGGTSAAEAVIRICNLKKEKSDPTPVFWSFRSPTLPKVNETLDKSLGEVVRSGMVPLPHSNAMAVLNEGDSKQYVIVRTRRLKAEDNPFESTYLEFEKERTMACLGSNAPTDFLAKLGIRELEVIDQDVEALAITPWFESARKNVFLVGEPLAPAYIQTTDFNPDADQVAVKQRRGSFKMSMRDGVMAIEAIRARLQDNADDEALKKLVIEFEAKWLEGFTPDAPAAKKVAAKKKKVLTAQFTPITDEEEEGRRVGFQIGSVSIDQQNGEVALSEAGEGATSIIVHKDGAYVADLGAGGMTQLEISVERTIEKGVRFQAGEQFFKIVDEDDETMLAILDEDQNPERLLTLPPEGQDFGRKDSASVVGINNQDLSLSRRHFRIQGEGTLFALRDYGSVNGTYIEVGDAEMKLINGDVVWAGNHRYRFDGMSEEETDDAAPAAAAPAAAAPAAAAPAAAETPTDAATPAESVAAPPADGALVASVLPQGQNVELDGDKTLLENLDGAGLATQDAGEAEASSSLLWSCGGKPSCYLCLVKVLSGAENLSEMEKKEKKGIKLKVSGLEDEGIELDADECRLACLARPTGPVQIELQGNTDL